MNPIAHPHRLVAVGAVGIAVTTAAEVVTAPYSAHVTLFGLNPAVHVVKALTAVVFVVGMIVLAVHHRASLGRVGAGAASALALGTAIGVIPYSVLEITVDPSMSPAEAVAWLDAAYAGRLAWITPLAAAGMLLVLVGLVTLGTVVLRRRALPRWRPASSLAAIPLAVLAAVAGGATGLPVPHPPTWVFLGLGIAYGARLRTVTRPGAAVLIRGRAPAHSSARPSLR